MNGKALGLRMTDIRADLGQYYPMKQFFETILGRRSFAQVKDYGPLSSWRAESEKLLTAIGLAAKATVEVADDEWRTEVQDLLTRGLSRIKSVKSIDELFASLAATLGELAFLQLGFVPRGHYKEEWIPMVLGNWKLTPVRTVQYVQSRKQLAAQEKMKRSRKRAGES